MSLPPELSPGFLLGAYAQGAFPMDDGDDDDGPVRFYAPDPRALIHLPGWRPSRSMRRAAARRPVGLRVDASFDEVVRCCAAPRRGDDGVWLSARFRRAYGDLHALGHAHSLEGWIGGRLAAGLYGIALGEAFFAESMFHRVPDAGTATLAAALEHLRDRGFAFCDVQFLTDHLARFGAVEVPDETYRELLAAALGAERPS